MKKTMKKEKLNAYQGVSNYKSMLMGIAIIWIVLFHFQFNIDTVPFQFVNFPVSIGYVGVDIFMFLSGIGVFFSLEKNSKVIPFYQRRAKRILPPYFPVIICYLAGLSIIEGITLLDVWSNLFMVSWWQDRQVQFNWYAQFILVVYLITPFLYQIVKRLKDNKKGLCGLFAFLFLFNISFLESGKFMAFARMLIYILGMYLASLLKEGKTLKNSTKLLWYAGGVLAAILFYICEKQQLFMGVFYSLRLYLPCVMIPAFCFLISGIFTRIEKNKAAAFIKRMFEIIGNASFEIYLIHLLILCIKPSLAELANQYRLTFIAGSVLMGIVYHSVMQKIIKTVSNINWNHKTA